MNEKADDHRILQDCEQNSPHIGMYYLITEMTSGSIQITVVFWTQK